MEDALALLGLALMVLILRSLNPCCNGRCTRTVRDRRNCTQILVLILVVMEDALAQITIMNAMNNFTVS